MQRRGDDVGPREEPGTDATTAHAAELRDALMQQQATADILRLISRSSFDLDTVLATLIRSAIVLCEATRGVVWLRRGENFHLAAQLNYPAEWVTFAQELAVRPSADAATTTGLAAFTGEVVNIADIPADPRFRSLSAHQLGDYRGGLAVPLRRDSIVVGVIGLSRYFSPGLAERLASGNGMAELSGQRREIAVLFTDITDFTGLIERMEPEVLGALLNDYLAGMTAIVFEHAGTLAKVIGDALHILFGAPDRQEDHAERAVSCAVALDQFAERFRTAWQERGIAVGATRIGVHSGPAIVGNFGGERFFDYTAYGDTINVAARLETANKALGTRICVSARVADAAPGFRWRPVGDLVLKGRNEPLRVLEPLPAGDGARASQAGYVAAFDKLEARDPGAIAAFAAEVGQRPDDQLCSFHLRRLLNGEAGSTIALDA